MVLQRPDMDPSRFGKSKPRSLLLVVVISTFLLCLAINVWSHCWTSGPVHRSSLFRQSLLASLPVLLQIGLRQPSLAEGQSSETESSQPSIQQVAEETRDCSCCKSDWCGCETCTDCYVWLKQAGSRLPLDARGAYESAGQDWASALGWQVAFKELPAVTAVTTPGDFRVAASQLPKAGDGLYTTAALAKGAVLPPYQGRVLDFAEGNKGGDYVWCPVSAGLQFYFQEEETTSGSLAREPSFCIDSSKTQSNNPARFVNGAGTKEECKAVNLEICQLGDVMYFRTTRPVPADTELITDYGDFYWSNGEPC